MDQQDTKPLTKREILKRLKKHLAGVGKMMLAAKELPQKDKDWVGKRLIAKILELDEQLNKIINP